MITRPAVFASAFHPHIGGVEELVRQLVAEQARRAMQPVVVTNHFPKTLPAVEMVEGTPVLRHVFRVPEPNWRQLGGWAVHSGRTQRSIAKQLRERGTDVVHVQCVSSNGRYARTAARSLDVPLVVTMQGELSMDASAVYARSSQMRATWRACLNDAAVITGCSQYVLDEAEAAYGRPLPAPSRVVYNGIRLADFDGVPHGRETGSPYVLGIGRMVPQKGFDLLIAAFDEVAMTRPDLRLLLAGDGISRRYLEAQAASAKNAERIRFLGSVDRLRAVQLFAGADVFVLASRHEPQGIVVLEAMAAGAPVVAASVGGVPEIVRHGVNGLLFEGGSCAALAVQLGRALEDEPLRATLRTAARRTAGQHDWTSVASAYDAVYSLASA
ncbi:MAG: putative glycosyltransferase, group 1 [Frankiales bacterium]|nr:putative glycosyltransferase, group 1 [Frankiales bacterium]